jgi:hypothetical protein
VSSIREHLDALFRFSRVSSVINVDKDVFNSLCEDLSSIQRFGANGPGSQSAWLPIILNYSGCTVEVRGPGYPRNEEKR